MSWGGDRARQEGSLHLLRTLMDRDGIGPEEALQRLRVGGLVMDGDVEGVMALHRDLTSTTIRVLRPLELSARGGPRPWATGWDSSTGYYWPRQRRYLSDRLHRAPYELDSLDRSTDRVLAHLEDPGAETGFSVRGLVIGYVQSGKTAHFSALIAKAVDAGYQIVIVLSGLHNTLRRQTQLRLQRDLGHEDTDGVGAPEPARAWVWMTGPDLGGDFNPAGQNTGVLQGNNRVILVVKKNKSRLDRLIRWMRQRVPAQVAVLVIDDEADQASINTGGNRAGFEPDLDQTDLTQEDCDGDLQDELDPSAINLRVRQLLGLFDRCSYVAYTATPFANVLIDPDAVDREGGLDLYPRDFMVCLPKPPGGGYVGTERLFGRDQLAGDAEDVEGLDVIEIVPDHELPLLIPPRRSPGGPTITPSLQQALRDFLLSAAGRLYRAGRDAPCTMLVHTDMRKALQDDIAAEIEAELAHLRQEWRYHRAGPLRAELADRWEASFRPRSSAYNLAWDVPFAVVEPHLAQLMTEGTPVRRLNSNHLDNADFDAEPTLKAVLVGGNKLSRGVTIEGLLVSYYVRLTPYYDTLLQMGRWFGYRGDFVDLTRLYSTQILVSWFHDLATAEEDLRRQVQLFEREGLTPLDAALRIRRHPVMLVTAQNKMGAGREIHLSYAATQVQTLRFPFGDPRLLERLRENLAYSAQMISSLGPASGGTAERPAWTGVGSDFVQEFLDGFWVMAQTSIDPASVRDYILAQNRSGELGRWSVVICGARDHRLGSEDLGVAGGDRVGLINRSRLAKDPTSLGVITEPDDELFGLPGAAVDQARAEAADGQFPSMADAVRSKRDPGEGLLLIYPISADSIPGPNAKNRVPLFAPGEPRCTLLGYALSFPASQSPATASYIQGPASRQR